MSFTLLGWILIVSSIAIPTLLAFPRSGHLPLDIEARLKLGKLAADSNAFGGDLRRMGRTLIVPAAIVLLVAGIGATASYLRTAPEAAASEDSDGELLTNLADYTRTVAAENEAPAAAAGNLLPDVNTMIERLEARLESAPDDVRGWRMLGWSYFNMGLYEKAAAAYAKAAELDPNSPELKAAYEEAKAKASQVGDAATAPRPQSEDLQADTAAKTAIGPAVETPASEAAPPHQNDAAIRSMVDGLAARLESSPRDVEGWTRLMRSRVVLGEREVAASALRKALDVFKDDSAASGQISAAAVELGLKAE